MSDNQSNLNSNATNTMQLSIEGMSCQTCALRIEKVLSKKPAIEAANVNFATETLNVQYDTTQIDADDIVEWVNKTGFKATVAHPEDGPSSIQGKQDKKLDWKLIVLWICLMPFMLGMLGMLLGQGMAWMIPVWLQFVLATFVQFVLAHSFYKSAWSSVRGGLANMDVLVVLGTVTIWLYSTYIWLSALIAANGFNLTYFSHTYISQTGNHLPVYFEASVMIIAFVRLGKYLENKTKKQSLNSINLLLELTPNTVEKLLTHSLDNNKENQAHIITPSAGSINEISDYATNDYATSDAVTDEQPQFVSVSLQEVQINDRLRAKQGSRIGTDGLVISGTAWCNESHLTGEYAPVKKQIGERVLAGALVDNGSIVYQVTATGRDTQLSDMVQALSEAQGSKANLARLADKVAAIFVPVVVSLALLTFILTWWLTGQMNDAMMHAVSVLVIACPCALGLATPAAIMAGMGVAARHGVWFKDAQSLEAAGNIDIVAFDKTGTITIGHPQIVTSMMMHSSIDSNDVLQLAASVEAHISHPLATAVVESAKLAQLPLLEVSDVQAELGAGAAANIEGYGHIKVGKPTFVGMNIPNNLPKIWDIASIVALSVDGIPLGMFALSDAIRQESHHAIEKLLQNDIDVVLLSGDKATAVDYVAEQVGIQHTLASMSPREKAEYINKIQDKGYKVAMVGDGVNDAPAMTAAHASFAMVQGTDIARHSASARLMGESLLQVNKGLDIADATVRNIKQNLFFAFIYNCLGIPLAAFGFLNPMLAAAAMALSSISVLTNALRLTRYKSYQDRTKKAQKD